MIVSFPRLIVGLAVTATLFGAATGVLAQIPAGSSARSIPTEIERTNGQVTQLIARAEDHFRKGKLNLDDNKREAARDEFDRAVDTLLESGLDVRANQRLQTFYLELVERIYREEVQLDMVSPMLPQQLWWLRTVRLRLQDKHKQPNHSRRRSRLDFGNRSSNRLRWMN